MTDRIKFRWPYPNHLLFSILAFLALVVPLAFSFSTYEKYETVKFGLWLALLGWAFCVCALGIKRGNFSTSPAEPEQFVAWPYVRPFVLLLTAFWLWAFFSSLHAFDRWHAFFGFYYRFTNGFLFYTIWLAFILLLLLTFTKDRFRFLMKILYFDAVCVSVLAIVQSLGVAFYGGSEPSGFLRAPSLLGNPNFSAMFLVCLIPAGLVFFSESRNFLSKIYYGLGFFALIWSMVLLSSRGAELAFVAGVLAFFLLLWKHKKISWRYGILSAIALVLAFGLWQASLNVVRVSAIAAPAASTSISADNVETRLYAWDVARRAILDHPWLGVGLGNFQIYFERNRGNQLASSSGVFDDAHNLLLHLAATGGLPLALLFLAVLALALWRTIKNSQTEALVLAAAAGMVAWAVAAAFTPVPIAAFLLLAVVLAGQIASGSPLGPRVIAAGRKSSLLVGAAGAVLMLFGLCFLAAETIFFTGYLDFFNLRASQSQKLSSWAAKLNPTNELYYIYQAASDIALGLPRPAVVKDINTVISKQSQEARTYVSAANLYFFRYQASKSQEDALAVIANMNQALGYDPLFSERYSQLGFYYFQFGDLANAHTYLQAGLTLNPGNFSAWMLLARVYQMQNKRPQALYALGQAYRLDPANLQLRGIWRIAQQTKDIQKVPLRVDVSQGSFE